MKEIVPARNPFPRPLHILEDKWCEIEKRLIKYNRGIICSSLASICSSSTYKGHTYFFVINMKISQTVIISIENMKNIFMYLFTIFTPRSHIAFPIIIVAVMPIA